MRSRWRSLVFPILIVVVALIVMWVSKIRQPIYIAPAEVEGFVRGAMVDGEYGATEPMLVSQLQHAWPTGEVVIEVSEVDDDDELATHRATLLVNGVVKLVVRCRYDANPKGPQLVGFSLRDVD